MQHPRAPRLREQPRDERPRGAARRARRRDEPHGGRLDGARQRAREERRGAGGHGPEGVADERDGDGVPDDVRDQPDEQLEGGGDEAEGEDGAALAEAGGQVDEGEAAEGDAGLDGLDLGNRWRGAYPEAGRDVADLCGVAGALGDEERYDPA